MENKKKIAAVAGTVAAAATVVTAAAAGVKLMSPKPSFPENFTVTAHTGCDGTKPNSIDSITVGFVSGADAVEFDLHFNKEGTPVMSHDTPVGGEFTVDEAFKYIAMYKSILVNVDVKDTADLRQVKTLAEKHGVLDRVFYTGVHSGFVEAVKEATPDIPYYLNMEVDVTKSKNAEYIDSLIEEVKNAGAIGINFEYTSCSKKLVDKFHENGLLVSIWTVNNRFDMKKAMSYGADNITTKKPTVFKSIMADFIPEEEEATELIPE